MQLVAVDIGNSSIKIAVEHPAHDLRWSREAIIRGSDSMPRLDLGDPPAFWAVSSVNAARLQKLNAWVAQHRPQDRFHVIQPQEVDLKTNVQSRERLGRDRLIGAWQAIQLNAADETVPAIIIDAGTAVTIDVVNPASEFLGGIIFPGAMTMLRTLAQQTDALPDLSEVRLTEYAANLGIQTKLSFVGQSTHDAILLGVYQTQRCTMKAAVNNLSKQFSTPAEVFVTGGGIIELLPWLPENWTHVPDLVLQGALNIGRRLTEIHTNDNC